MKRIWALIATLALLAGMLSVGGSFVTAATFRLGDVNGNGAVDTSDVRALLNWIVSNDTMSADLKAELP